jgi:hypothetical protein
VQLAHRPTRPVRLRLSRAKGFDLRVLSKDTNGLDVVVVARPGKWGNPFPVRVYGRNRAIARYRAWLAETMRADTAGRLDLAALRGKNLACWCKPGEACHADVLLALANRYR